MHRGLARQGAHQFAYVFEFSQRLPASITRAPVQPRREPNRKRLGKILIGMALRVPIVEIDDVTAAEWTWPVGIRCFLPRCAPEDLAPLFLAGKLIGVGVGVRCFMPHQFHKPFRRTALDFEHHCPLQRAESVVHEKKRYKDRRHAHRYEPFVADVNRWIKGQSMR